MSNGFFVTSELLVNAFRYCENVWLYATLIVKVYNFPPQSGENV